MWILLTSWHTIYPMVPRSRHPHRLFTRTVEQSSFWPKGNDKIPISLKMLKMSTNSTEVTNCQFCKRCRRTYKLDRVKLLYPVMCSPPTLPSTSWPSSSSRGSFRREETLFLRRRQRMRPHLHPSAVWEVRP